MDWIKHFIINNADYGIEINDLRQGLWCFNGNSFDYIGVRWCIIEYKDDWFHGKAFTQDLKDRKMITDKNFSHGYQNGICRTYHPNGNISIEKNYIKGKKDGLKIIYNIDGRILQKKKYKLDTLIYKFIYSYDDLDDMEEFYLPTQRKLTTHKKVSYVYCSDCVIIKIYYNVRNR